MPCSTRCNNTPRNAAVIATRSCCGVRGASIDTFMIISEVRSGASPELTTPRRYPRGNPGSQNFFTFRDNHEALGVRNDKARRLAGFASLRPIAGGVGGFGSPGICAEFVSVCLSKLLHVEKSAIPHRGALSVVDRCATILCLVRDRRGARNGEANSTDDQQAYRDKSAHADDAGQTRGRRQWLVLAHRAECRGWSREVVDIPLQVPTTCEGRRQAARPWTGHACKVQPGNRAQHCRRILADDRARRRSNGAPASRGDSARIEAHI